MTTDAVFNFIIPARKGTVRHHAQALTVDSAQIDIPPDGGASLTGEWHPPVAMNMVQISPHQHHRGALVSVHRVDTAGSDMGELVRFPNWEHPSVRWWPQALRLESGKGIRFTCDWQNPTTTRQFRSHDRG